MVFLTQCFPPQRCSLFFCSKPDPRSVRVFASEDERYYPTPPHQSPTPGQCVCLQAKMNAITPPHPTQPKPDPISRVFASEDERYYLTPPHPTQPKPDPRSVRVFASEDERYYPTPPNQSPTPAQCTQPKPDPSSVRVFASEDERYYPTPPHPTPETLARAHKRLLR